MQILCGMAPQHATLVSADIKAHNTALAWNGWPHKGDNLVLPGQWQAIGAPEEPHGGTPLPGHLFSAPECQQLRLTQVVHRHQVCIGGDMLTGLMLRLPLHVDVA